MVEGIHTWCDWCRNGNPVLGCSELAKQDTRVKTGGRRKICVFIVHLFPICSIVLTVGSVHQSIRDMEGDVIATSLLL